MSPSKEALVQSEARSVAREVTGGGRRYQYAISAARELIEAGREFTRDEVLELAEHKWKQTVTASASALAGILAPGDPALRQEIVRITRGYFQRGELPPPDPELVEAARKRIAA